MARDLNAKPRDRGLEKYNPIVNRMEKVNKIKYTVDGPSKPKTFSPKNKPREKDMIPIRKNSKYHCFLLFFIFIHLLNRFIQPIAYNVLQTYEIRLCRIWAEVRSTVVVCPLLSEVAFIYHLWSQRFYTLLDSLHKRSLFFLYLSIGAQHKLVFPFSKFFFH